MAAAVNSCSLYPRALREGGVMARVPSCAWAVGCQRSEPCLLMQSRSSSSSSPCSKEKKRMTLTSRLVCADSHKYMTMASSISLLSSAGSHVFACRSVSDSGVEQELSADGKVESFSEDWNYPEEPSGMFSATQSIFDTVFNELGETMAGKLERGVVATPAELESFDDPQRNIRGQFLFLRGTDEDMSAVMQLRIHIKGGPGKDMLFMGFNLWPGQSTDAPAMICELVVAPSRITFGLDLIPRRSYLENTWYWKEVYEDSGFVQFSAEVEKDPNFQKMTSKNLLASPYFLFCAYPAAANSAEATIAEGDTKGSTEGDMRPLSVGAREHIEPLAKKVVAMWLKLYSQRKGNVPEGPDREELKRRDTKLRFISVNKDFSGEAISALLGPYWRALISRNLIQGGERLLTLAQHWALGKPFWRLWKGVAYRYTPSGDLIESIRMYRDLCPSANEKKVVHRTLRLVHGERQWDGPWDWDSSTSHEDGIHHPSFGSSRLLQLPGGRACTSWRGDAGQTMGCELSAVEDGGETRFSVSVVYGPDGDLQNIIYDAEAAVDSEEETIADKTVETGNARTSQFVPKRQLEGLETTLTSSLRLSEFWGAWKPEGPEDADKTPGEEDPVPSLTPEDYVQLDLPNNLSLRAPTNFPSGGRKFSIAVTKKEGTAVEQLTARFGHDGKVSSFTRGVYY
eukprot:TRINITY_DN1293_c0_g2_i1.p1 TRINITY_DN1293_c0_g2~~TRINITY_DN1293_c0_g2_i1.p1  ORF type:complete len:683 (-),score=104.47 TRINITY_DN1293_c0_g2_i1:364-2412(-)